MLKFINKINFLLIFTLTSLEAQQNYSIKFDGLNDFVSIPDDSSLDLTNDYTIEAWVLPQEFGFLQGIVSKYQTNAANGYTLRLSQGSPYSGISFDGKETKNGALTKGVWQHVAAVKKGTARNVYVNGVKIDLSQYSAHNVVANNNTLRIGSDYSSRYFNGNIDEVRIWNVPRTSDQISQKMHSSLNIGIIMSFGDVPGFYESNDRQYVAIASNQGSSQEKNEDLIKAAAYLSDATSCSYSAGSYGLRLSGSQQTPSYQNNEKSHDCLDNFVGTTNSFYQRTTNGYTYIFAISDAVMDQLNSAMSKSESGLVAYYNFNEASGDTLFDKSTNKNHGILSGNPLRSTIGSPPKPSQLTFETINISTDLDGATHVHAGDLDSDGDMDLTYATLLGHEIGWLENQGNYTFKKHTLTTSATNAYKAYAVDLDNDGDLDIVSASGSDRKVRAFYNNISVDGTFTEKVVSNEARDINSLYFADIDSDGDMDLIGGETYYDGVYWFQNNGPSWTRKTVTRSVNDPTSVFALDMDEDGDTDVLSASYKDNKIAWYENDGSENFTQKVVSTSALGARGVWASDIDKDGDVDIFSASQSDNKIVLYENDGTQTFTTKVISSDAAGAWDVFTKDIFKFLDIF